MEKETPEKEQIEVEEKVSFGYIPSIIFLVFIGFVIYISMKG